MQGTAAEGAGWKKCFRAAVNGFASSTFHSPCDNKPITLTIVRVGDYIFGGYADNLWNKGITFHFTLPRNVSEFFTTTASMKIGNDG